jgi:hypothetical protein
MRVSKKLKKTRAQAGLVKKFLQIKERIIDSLSSRNMHVVGPAFEFPGMSLHSSHGPMWFFSSKAWNFFYNLRKISQYNIGIKLR